jgi:hypothetical protein
MLRHDKIEVENMWETSKLLSKCLINLVLIYSNKIKLKQSVGISTLKENIAGKVKTVLS